MNTVLIIEDDPFVQRVYEKLFSHANYEVVLAPTGIEGLEKAKTLQPKIILLDISLPQMDGIQILKKLKNDSQTKEISVIMLTNLNDDKTVQTAMQFGADGFLVKSNVPPEQLLTEVEKRLAPKL